MFCYDAADPGSGRVEREWDHVLVATLTGGTPAPDEAEVSGYAWVAPGSLRAEITTHPGTYTPWLRAVLDVAISAQ